MKERLSEKSCPDFASALASREPVPGGGGAAALAGALGAALASMVGNLTLGRKKYAVYEDDIRRILERAGGVRERLLALIDEDAEGFEPLSRAYSIPKEDPDRERILTEATLTACRAPLEMMRQICCAVELLEELTEKGSVMLLSDVGCGSALCRGALEAASLNIFINTKTLQDREAAERLDRETDEMLSVYVPRAQAVTDAVQKRLRQVRK